MRITRLYADPAGTSHFEEVEAELTAVDFAPPAPPLELTAPVTCSRFALIGVPAGWYGDWHPVPQRQYMLYLSGGVEVEASDGERRHFSAGSVTLIEDTSGAGHRTWDRGQGATVIAVVQLPDPS
jgi:hypothetical protein